MYDRPSSLSLQVNATDSPTNVPLSPILLTARLTVRVTTCCQAGRRGERQSEPWPDSSPSLLTPTVGENCFADGWEHLRVPTVGINFESAMV